MRKIRTVITAALLGLGLGMLGAQASAGAPQPLPAWSGFKPFQYDSGSIYAVIKKLPPAPAWINETGRYRNTHYHNNHLNWTHYRNRVCKSPEFENFSERNAREQEDWCRHAWVGHVINMSGLWSHVGTRTALLRCEWLRQSQRGVLLRYLPQPSAECVAEEIAKVRSVRRIYAGQRATDFGHDLKTGELFVSPESLDPWAWAGPIRVDP